MKKKILFLILPIAFLMLSGCANANDYLTSKLEEKTLEDSGILEDQDYQEYQNAEESGQLDENGYYLDGVETKDLSDNEEEPTGQIHVTFADNSHIKVTYYLDAERTEQIDSSKCYLNPGERIYVSNPEIVEVYSNKYIFSKFRILKFDSNDKQETFEVVLEDDNLVYEIPTEYAGDKLSVMPLGRYEARVLTLDDRYLDVNGNEMEFHGVWRVDSSEFIGTTAEISSIVDYKVNYDYSDYANDYYFVKSTPEAFRVDDGGLIEFENSTAQNGCEDYYVLLHRYINIKVSNGDYSVFNKNIIKSLNVNGEGQGNLKIKELMLESRKCGDVITIRVDSNYKVTVSGLDITNPVDVENGNAQEYKITIPETTELELGIIVSKKTATLGNFTVQSINNATITVTDEDGNLLQSGDEVDDNEKLTVTVIPASGYYITGKKVKNDVYQDTMKYKEYVSDIADIIDKHPIKKFISVTLTASDDYGTCVYTIEGNVVSDTVVSLREGQKVKLEYTLTDSNYQIDGGWFGSKTKKTETIEISDDFDGKALSREDFNIKLKDK